MIKRIALHFNGDVFSHISLPLSHVCAFASMYIDMYVCKYIVYVYKMCEFSYAYACSSTCVYACIQMPEQDIRSLSFSLHLIILKHGLSLSWKETVENCLTSRPLLCSMWGSAT